MPGDCGKAARPRAQPCALPARFVRCDCPRASPSRISHARKKSTRAPDVPQVSAARSSRISIARIHIKPWPLLDAAIWQLLDYSRLGLKYVPIRSCTPELVGTHSILRPCALSSVWAYDRIPDLPPDECAIPEHVTGSGYVRVFPSQERCRKTVFNGSISGACCVSTRLRLGAHRNVSAIRQHLQESPTTLEDETGVNTLA